MPLYRLGDKSAFHFFSDKSSLITDISSGYQSTQMDAPVVAIKKAFYRLREADEHLQLRNYASTQGRVIRRYCTLKASSPISMTWHLAKITIIGIESMYAVAKPVTAFCDALYPDVTKTTDFIRRTRIGIGCTESQLAHDEPKTMLKFTLIKNSVVDIEDGTTGIPTKTSFFS